MDRRNWTLLLGFLAASAILWRILDSGETQGDAPEVPRPESDLGVDAEAESLEPGASVTEGAATSQRILDDSGNSTGSEAEVMVDADPAQAQASLSVRLSATSIDGSWAHPVRIVLARSGSEPRVLGLDPPHEGHLSLEVEPGDYVVRLFDTLGVPESMHTGVGQSRSVRVEAGEAKSVVFDVSIGGRIAFDVNALDLPRGGAVSIHKQGSETETEIRPYEVDPHGTELLEMLAVSPGHEYRSPVLSAGAWTLLVRDRESSAIRGRVDFDVNPGELRWVELNALP